MATLNIYELDAQWVVHTINAYVKDVTGLELGTRNILLLIPNFEVTFVNRRANVAFFILAGVDILFPSPHPFESIYILPCIADGIQLEKNTLIFFQSKTCVMGDTN